MTKKPDYVNNFSKPINTEIKYINGHWYLYERSNVYDPKIKRSRKKSGKCLGSIKEDGFVPSKTTAMPTASDVVEAGAVGYFYQQTESMRLRLQRHFPDLWKQIYCIVLLRAIYDNRFRRLELHYAKLLSSSLRHMVIQWHMKRPT